MVEFCFSPLPLAFIVLLYKPYIMKHPRYPARLNGRKIHNTFILNNPYISQLCCFKRTHAQLARTSDLCVSGKRLHTTLYFFYFYTFFCAVFLTTECLYSYKNVLWGKVPLQSSMLFYKKIINTTRKLREKYWYQHESYITRNHKQNTSPFLCCSFSLVYNVWIVTKQTLKSIWSENSLNELLNLDDLKRLHRHAGRILYFFYL